MYEIITSTQNPKIKNIQKLDKSAERKSQNLIIIEGEIELNLALSANIEIINVFFCKELIPEFKVNDIFGIYKKNNVTYFNKIQFFEVSKPVFDKIAYRENSFGMVALARPIITTLNTLKLPKNPLLIVLESVEKPGNLGAILRTADAANVDAVIICDPQTDIFNPNAVRASIGCVFTKPVVACTSEEAIIFLKSQNINMYATALTASKPYDEISYKTPSAIILGTEATGLSKIWLENATQNIIIPMQGKIDSMNVSVATAIVIFEAIRQRKYEV